MSETKIHECPECGFTWRHGHSGSHNCSIRLKARVRELETELHLRRECERMADGSGLMVVYANGKYSVGFSDNLYTLQELHNKLTELTEAE